ncbi:MAG: MarR family transcriptional regulator [Jatrophihabitans sp.]
MPRQRPSARGFLLWHITLRWQREVAAALNPFGLTHVQFVLLASTWWLNTHDAADTLARRLVVTVAGTSVVPTAIEAVEAVDRALMEPRSPTAARAFAGRLRRLRLAGESADSQRAQHR